MDSGIKVLIVDDDDVILFLHELIIRESGLSQDTTCFLTCCHNVVVMQQLTQFMKVHQKVHHPFIFQQKSP